MLKIILAITIIVMITSCKTTIYTKPEDCLCKQVTIGEGGGVTGQTTRYILLENGQVFLQTVFPQEIREYAMMDKKSTREIFKKMDELNLAALDFEHPGNMTYSLGFKDGQDVHEIKWGDPGSPPPEAILEYYRYLRDKIEKTNKP